MVASLRILQPIRFNGRREGTGGGRKLAGDWGANHPAPILAEFFRRLSWRRRFRRKLIIKTTSANQPLN